jgi:hypothetical protein
MDTTSTTAAATDIDPRTLRTFAEFYPFYLGEHRNGTCRRLHFTGMTLGLVCLALLALTGNGWWFLAALVAGYGCSWAGHYVFEKNRPATFKRPLYSFMGDCRMYKDMWTGRVPF